MKRQRVTRSTRKKKTTPYLPQCRTLRSLWRSKSVWPWFIHDRVFLISFWHPGNRKEFYRSERFRCTTTQQMEDGTVYIFQLGRRLKMWLAAASSSVCAIGTESSPVSCSLWYKMCVYRLADVPHAITTSAGPFPRDKWGLVLMDPSRPSRRPLTCRPSFWHSNVLPLLLFFTTFPPPTEFFGCRRCKIMAV